MKIRSKALALAFGSTALLLGVAGHAFASDTYPSRPIRVIVPNSAGGGLDVTTRRVLKKMSENLGQPIVVENRSGADTLVGTRIARTAPADGYTLLSNAATITIQPFVKEDPGYDLLKDFVGIGPMARSPFMLLVPASGPDQTLADFVARAKANPNKLSFASAGVGTTTHLVAAMFLHESGLQLLHVPYKGNAAAMPDVLGGRINMIFGSYDTTAGNIKANQVRPLGVSSTSRITPLPALPTIAEQGYRDFSYYYWSALFAPAGTPKAIVDRLAEALRYALSSADLEATLRAEGTEVMKQSPAEFSEFLKAELAKMAKLVDELKIPKQ